MMKEVWIGSSALKRETLVALRLSLLNSAEFFSPALAKVPSKLKRLCQEYWFPGDCFPMAIGLIVNAPQLSSAEYVLGKTAKHKTPHHGWVEYENFVFEPVLQEWYVKETYYDISKLIPQYRFSREATIYLDQEMRRLPKLMYRWDRWLKLQAGTNTPISLEQAKSYLDKANQARSSKARSEKARQGIFNA